MRQRVYLIILTVLVIVSLGLNVFLVREALLLRRQLSAGGQTAVETLDVAITQLDELATASFTVEFPVDEEVDVETTIAFDEEFRIPINTTVPIDTTVNVPIQIGPFGRYNIEVPIETEVPVSLTVPININRDVPVEATVPIQLTVPIEIEIADTPIADQLVVWERTLLRMRGQIIGALNLPDVAPTPPPDE